MLTSLSMISFQVFSLLLSIISTRYLILKGELDYLSYVAFIQLCFTLFLFVDFGLSRSVIFVLASNKITKPIIDGGISAAHTIAKIASVLTLMMSTVFVAVHANENSILSKAIFVSACVAFIYLSVIGNFYRLVIESQKKFLLSSLMRLAGISILQVFAIMAVYLDYKSLNGFFVVVFIRLACLIVFERRMIKSLHSLAGTYESADDYNQIPRTLKNFSLFSSFSSITNFMDRILSSFMLPTSTVGLYMNISDLSTKLSIVTVVNSSQLQVSIHGSGSHNNLIRNYYIKQAVLYGFPALALIIFANEIILLYTGQSYDGLSLAFAYLIIAGFISSFVLPIILKLQVGKNILLLSILSILDMLTTASLIFTTVSDYSDLGKVMLIRSVINLVVYSAAYAVSQKFPTRHGSCERGK